MRLSRRNVIKTGVGAGVALAVPLAWQFRSSAQSERISPFVPPFSLPFRVPPELRPLRSDATTDFYNINIQRSRAEILPGLFTDIFSYNGISPGPTIRQRQGRRSVVRFTNQLGSVPAVVHLHGSASVPEYDGYPEDLIPPGFFKDYRYPNNRAATIWYHDHAWHITELNVYKGLAGMYIVQDDLELGLNLPSGSYDVPLIIADRLFNPDGSFLFDSNGDKSLFGDVILVNGVPWTRMQVANRKYRFRILNASSSRSYELGLSNRDSFTVIGSDGGLFPNPVQTSTLIISMAERYEIIIDFSKYRIGTQIVLGNYSPINNRNFENTGLVMRFDVSRSEVDPSRVPANLRPFQRLDPATALRTREFAFERGNGLWQINGQVWNRNQVIAAIPRVGDREIWRFINRSGGWFHPIHVHLVDYQILSRQGPRPLANYERFMKDTVYLGENEVIDVIAQFGPNEGMYVMHCHNTIHEDHDMMVQFRVGKGGRDPITGDPARRLPAPPL